MHTTPRMHMAADETRTWAPSNTSTPDRHGQPAREHDMAGASFTRRAHTWICATRICMRALLHIYNTMVAHMCVCMYSYICIYHNVVVVVVVVGRRVVVVRPRALWRVLGGTAERCACHAEFHRACHWGRRL